MSQASLIPLMQSESLAREVERQLKNEINTVNAAAERDRRAIVTQASAAARRRVHEAIQELRREGAVRLAAAEAQLETEQRGWAQRQAAQAVSDVLPLLRELLDVRWRDPQNRRQWTDAVARLCPARLRPGRWSIAHPPDWSEPEQRQFAAIIGATPGTETIFTTDADLTSGLRIAADQAVLDATPRGLLADSRAIAALILEEIVPE